MEQACKNPLNRLMLWGVLFCPLYFIACAGINLLVMDYLGMKQADVWILSVSRAMQWLLLLLTILYAARIEKQEFLLWKNQPYKIYILLAHILLLYITVMFMLIPIRLLIHFGGFNPISPKLSHIKAILLQYPIMLPVFAITAGIVEEYIFRGYMQPRLERIFKSPAGGIIINSLLFGAIHFGYGTLTNVLGPFVIGIIFSIYYWKYRNIYTLILCHILIDLIALYTIVHSTKF